MDKPILTINNRLSFRSWLKENGSKEKECFLILKRGKPTDPNVFYYLDAVEEALCFGWIDSTLTKHKGLPVQRFTPRSKQSNWTELNKERARRLIALHLMTEAGKKVLPPLGPHSFHPHPQVIQDLKDRRVYSKFKQFPPLYQRIRLSNLEFYLTKLTLPQYQKMLAHVVQTTLKGELFGEWNDYGRLLWY